MDRTRELELAKKVCRNKDAEAFRLLETPCLEDLYRHAQGLYRGRDGAEDNVQITRVRAFEKSCTFRGESCFCTWMKRISTNLFLDEIRTKGLGFTISLSGADDSENKDAPLNQIPDKELSPEELAEQKEFEKALKGCLECLSDRQRRIFHMRWCGGMTLTEIGEALGIAYQAAHQRLATIYNILGQCLESKGFDYTDKLPKDSICTEISVTHMKEVLLEVRKNDEHTQ